MGGAGETMGGAEETMGGVGATIGGAESHKVKNRRHSV